jgi:hypothetical protein
LSKIIITIKDGEIKSKVEGILGTSCKDTDKFLKELGNVIKDNKTKEYYQSNVEVTSNVKLQG